MDEAQELEQAAHQVGFVPETSLPNRWPQNARSVTLGRRSPIAFVDSFPTCSESTYLVLWYSNLIVWETQVQLVTSQVVTPYPTTFVGSGSKIRVG